MSGVIVRTAPSALILSDGDCHFTGERPGSGLCVDVV